MNMIKKDMNATTQSSFDYLSSLVKANLDTFKPQTKDKLVVILGKDNPTPEEKSFVLDCVEYGKG